MCRSCTWFALCRRVRALRGIDLQASLARRMGYMADGHRVNHRPVKPSGTTPMPQQAEFVFEGLIFLVISKQTRLLLFVVLMFSGEALLKSGRYFLKLKVRRLFYVSRLETLNEIYRRGLRLIRCLLNLARSLKNYRVATCFSICFRLSLSSAKLYRRD